MKLSLRRVFQFLPDAFLLLGLATPARSQNTLMVPGMTYCEFQWEASSVNLSELYGDVLTFSIVISTTATGPTQTIFTHHGSFYPPNGFVVINPPKPGTYFWRLCANNPSKFSAGVGGAISPNTGFVGQPTTV
jgi:hypothetical protein